MKTLSAIVGVLATITIPRFLRPFFFLPYCLFYKVNRQELPRAIKEFRNFQDFFTREIESKLRPIAGSRYVSPVDGLLVEFGYFSENKEIEVKSLSYLLNEFIPDSSLNKYFRDGLYLILYLSPKDYHRIHCPLDCTLSGYFRVSGDLKTVNPSQGAKLPKILATNERVISILEDQIGKKVALVKVGATNVGSITFSLSHDSVYPTNYTNSGQSIKKGQEVAKFNLGSTVVLCFEKNSFSSINLKVGQHYKMGQELELQ